MFSKASYIILICAVVCVICTNSSYGDVPTFFAGKKVTYNTHFDTSPIDMFPIDWNQDGTRDLVLAFNDGRIGVCYNEGTNLIPKYITVNYFKVGGFDLNAICAQTEGLRIWITDWDNDGDQDLLVGGDFAAPEDWGAIRIYYNTGDPANLDFTDEGHLIINGTENWNDFAFPCVVDWNADGKKDFIIFYTIWGGDSFATLYLNVNPKLDNEAGAGPPVFTPASATALGSPLDGAAWDWDPSPAITDWDNDGDWDFIFGSSKAYFWSSEGKIYLWQNTGTNVAPNFVRSLIQSNGANITTGCNHPHVLDWDGDGKKDIIVGTLSGKIYVYTNTGADAAPTFDNAPPVYNPSYITKLADLDIGSNACPVRADYNNDGLKDLIIGDSLSRIWILINTGTDINPTYLTQDRVQFDGANLTVPGNGRATPFLVDWNNDGKIDLLAGCLDGIVHIYINSSGNNNPVFTSAGYSRAKLGVADIDVGNNSRPVVTDWDGDGKKDLIVGASNGRVFKYINIGTDAAPSFVNEELLLVGGATLDVGNNAAPHVIDIDGDGMKDMVVGSDDGKVYGFINTNADPNSEPLFVNQAVLQAEGIDIDVGTDAIPYITELNGDLFVDIIIGGSDGFTWRHLNTLGNPEPGPPSVTNINPSTGKNNLTTDVTITGQWFNGAFAVKLDDPMSTPLTNLVVVNNNTITAQVPTGIAPGSYNVQVSTPLGTNVLSAVKFQVTSIAPPVVMNIDPNTGPNDQTTWTVITGQNFTGTTSVKLNDLANTALTGWVVTDAQTIFGAVVPVGVTPGVYDVIVTNADGSNLVSAVKFYVNSPNPPAVTDISPQLNINNTTTTLTISGTGFSKGVVSVNLDDIFTTEITGWIVQNDILITNAVVPAGVRVGQYNVKVTTTAGTNLTSTVRLLVNSPLMPVVTSIDPMSGINVDDTTISISGNGFENVSVIHLDDPNHTLLTGWTYVNDGLITGAVIPAGLPIGEYNVQVTTPNGTNPESQDKFFVNGPDAPIVTEISPSSGKNNTETAIQVKGLNFFNVSTIRIDDLNRNKLTGWTVDGRTQISGAVIPSGLPPGDYNIWVTTPSGTNVISHMKFKVLPSSESSGVAPAIGGGAGGGGGGCFLATSAYEKQSKNISKQSGTAATVRNFTGTYTLSKANLEKLNRLRRLRDDKLLKSAAGRNFVRLYYTLSPCIAESIRHNEPLKGVVRKFILAPLAGE